MTPKMTPTVPPITHMDLEAHAVDADLFEESLEARELMNTQALVYKLERKVLSLRAENKHLHRLLDKLNTLIYMERGSANGNL